MAPERGFRMSARRATYFLLGVSTNRRVLSLYKDAHYHSLDRTLVVNLPHEPCYMVLAIS